MTSAKFTPELQIHLQFPLDSASWAADECLQARNPKQKPWSCPHLSLSPHKWSIWCQTLSSRFLPPSTPTSPTWVSSFLSLAFPWLLSLLLTWKPGWKHKQHKAATLLILSVISSYDKVKAGCSVTCRFSIISPCPVSISFISALTPLSLHHSVPDNLPFWVSLLSGFVLAVPPIHALSLPVTWLMSSIAPNYSKITLSPKYGHMIFKQDARTIRWRKVDLFNKWSWDNEYPHAKE